MLLLFDFYMKISFEFLIIRRLKGFLFFIRVLLL
jgi:hypothetical protein